MQMIDIEKLQTHPKNDYFFDNITGDNWDAFLESVRTSGIIEAIIITNNCVVVSGHQRLRAAKELGKLQVPCEVGIYESDDAILKDLLETNLRQRGIGNTNAVKFARCIVELERIYGIRQGSAGNIKASEQDNLAGKTQPQLADELGMSRQQLQDYKKLLTLIPELQDLVEHGNLSPSVGYKVLSKLSKEDQQNLVKEFGSEYISNLTKVHAEQIIKEKEALQNQLNIERNKPAKIVDKTDYSRINYLQADLKKKESDLSYTKQKLDVLRREVEIYKTDSEKYNDLQKQIEFLSQEKTNLHRQIESATELSKLAVEIDNLLKTKLAGLRYSRFLERLDNSEAAYKNFVAIIESVESWTKDMKSLLPNNNADNFDVEYTIV